MRHINQNNILKCLDEEELKSLKKLEKELKGLATIKEKKAFIDSNDSSWSEVKKHFRRYSNDICWLCETDTSGLFGDLEHYRPKKRVEGVKGHDGYWWLAFNINNFLYSCKTCNSKYNDEDGITYGKGNLFGLLDETKRVTYTNRNNMNLEEPLFLNPYNLEDVKLINFDLNNGNVIPNIGISDDSKKRVEYTAEKLLNRYRMNYKRLDEMKELLKLLRNYKKTLKSYKLSKETLSRFLSKNELEKEESLLELEKSLLDLEETIKDKVLKSKRFYLAKYYCLKQKNRRLFDKLKLEVEDKISFDYRYISWDTFFSNLTKEQQKTVKGMRSLGINKATIKTMDCFKNAYLSFNKSPKSASYRQIHYE